MTFILSFIRREMRHFSTVFNTDTQRLFFSNLFKTSAQPITSIFVAAFIWNITHSLVPVALYSIGSFLGLLVSFFINGYLLRYVRIKTLYWIGAVSDGLTMLLVVLYSSDHPLTIIFFGLFWGMGRGLYWSNRNYLELQETTGGNRQYFFGLMSAADWLSGIIIPFIAGWFIVFGERAGAFTSEHAYWILFVFVFIFMLCSAIVISGGLFVSAVPTIVTRFRLQRRMNGRRALSFMNGMIGGISFLSPLLILSFVGQEGALGTITSLVAVVSALAMYVYGRLVDGRHQHMVMFWSGIAYILSTFALLLLRSPMNVIVFIVVGPVAVSFFNLAINPILLARSDSEMNGSDAIRYSFIFDNEFFLNAGRIIGVLAVLALTVFGSETTGLLYGPLVGATVLAGALGIFVIRRRK